MKPIFLETSSLLSVLFREDSYQQSITKLRNSARIFASRLLRVEAERALMRLVLEDPTNEKQIPRLKRELEEFCARIDFLEMNRDICDRAARVSPQIRLRSLDAIHLASFYKLKELAPELEMLTLDERILEAIENPL